MRIKVGEIVEVENITSAYIVAEICEAALKACWHFF